MAEAPPAPFQDTTETATSASPSPDVASSPGRWCQRLAFGSPPAPPAAKPGFWLLGSPRTPATEKPIAVACADGVAGPIKEATAMPVVKGAGMPVDAKYLHAETSLGYMEANVQGEK